MHANTVGITNRNNKKDIYVIKNRINNKVYVGQSVNTAERFIQHCKPSSALAGSLIGKAIQKYGANNFWYEILESQIPNYNEREKYWIAKFNSIKPNGYNIGNGGEDPPVHYSIEHPLSTFSNLDEVKAIKDDLRNTRDSLSEIALRHNTSKRTVLRINQGLHYEELGEEYPIRKVPLLNGKLTDEQVAEIIEILKYSYRQYEDISRQYGVQLSTIKGINAGYCHPLEGYTYPIRTYKNSGRPIFTYAQVTEIIDLLQNTKISMNQIAKCYNVSVNSVIMVNNGSAIRYRRDNIEYPIRKHNPVG